MLGNPHIGSCSILLFVGDDDHPFCRETYQPTTMGMGPGCGIYGYLGLAMFGNDSRENLQEKNRGFLK